MDFVKTEDNFDEEYEWLTFGDIIWAKRYNNETSMQLIVEGHKEGPYIVIGKYGKRLKCLYCSSVYPKDMEDGYKFLKLENLEYSLSKSTYVNVAKNCYMARSRFIKRIGHLNPKDERTLIKKLDIARRKEMNVEMEIDIPEISLEPGDIVQVNKKNYLIIDINDGEYYCIKMKKDSNDASNYCIVIGENKYYLDFLGIKKISKNTPLVRENFIDNVMLKKVLVSSKQKIEQYNRRFEMGIGSLIRINGINYYIYGEINKEWIAFPLTGQIQNHLCCIIVCGKHFYTDFRDSIQISKNQNGVETIGVASENEIQEIKKLKKSYRKINKNGEGKSIYEILKENDMQSGTIVKCKKDATKELYIVVIRNDTELVTIKYNDYLNGEYTLKKLFVNEVNKIGCMDNFDLKQVLLDIQDVALGYINKKRLSKMINNF